MDLLQAEVRSSATETITAGSDDVAEPNWFIEVNVGTELLKSNGFAVEIKKAL